MRNVYASVAFALIAVLAADPALAQFNGGGDVPFQQGSGHRTGTDIR